MKNILKAKLIVGLILVIGFGASTAAYAGTVTINFTGTVIAGSALGAFAGQGTAVTGFISYDMSVMPTSNTSSLNTFLSNQTNAAGTGNAQVGRQWALSITVGGTNRSVLSTSGIPLFNFGLFDRDGIANTVSNDLWSFVAGSKQTGGLGSIVLNDSGGGISGGGGPGRDAVTNLTAVVPQLPPDLLLFGGTKIGRWDGNFVGDESIVRFNIDTMTLAQSNSVPEPGTLALLAAGLLIGGVATFRRKLQ